MIIRGTVVRCGVTRPLATAMDFICGKCGGRVTAAFPEGKFTPPTKCSEQGCRSKSFAPNRYEQNNASRYEQSVAIFSHFAADYVIPWFHRSSAQCKDWKKLRVQEVVGVDKQQAGQVRGGRGGR